MGVVVDFHGDVSRFVHAPELPQFPFEKTRVDLGKADIIIWIVTHRRQHVDRGAPAGRRASTRERPSFVPTSPNTAHSKRKSASFLTTRKTQALVQAQPAGGLEDPGPPHRRASKMLDVSPRLHRRLPQIGRHYGVPTSRTRRTPPAERRRRLRGRLSFGFPVVS